MTWGFSRVSTMEQSLDKFHNTILEYSNNKDLGKVYFCEEKISGRKNWKERELGVLINEKCKSGDVIIVPELSRLSRSISQIYEIITVCLSKNISVHFIKENFVISKETENEISSRVLLHCFGMISDMERTLISQRTVESLRYKKMCGVKLGRPKGVGKSKLDQYSEEIKSFRQTGSTKTWISEHYGVTTLTLSNWMKKHGVQ